MELQQKLESALNVISRLELKVNQLENRVESMSSFLKQQFGEQFVFDFDTPAPVPASAAAALANSAPSPDPVNTPMATAMPTPIPVQMGMQGPSRPSSENQVIKPKGRMTAYAFFVQAYREEHKNKFPGQPIVFSSFSRNCAEKWKAMSDPNKKQFHDMAKLDKERYDREMKVPPKAAVAGSSGTTYPRRRMNKKDAPNKPLSPFFFFCNDERQKIKDKNPGYGIGQVAIALGDLWYNTDIDVRRKYEELAKQDKERYKRELLAYTYKQHVEARAAAATETEIDEDDEEDGE